MGSTSVSHFASATSINFTGTLNVIEVDVGSTSYSGLTIGDSFSGNITFGDNSADASSIGANPPVSTDYYFTGAPYGGSITNGSITTIGSGSVVGLGDNDGMGDDAFYLNNLYGAGATSAGEIADTWFVDSYNSLQFFGLTLYSLDTSLYSGLTFQALPPLLNESDFAVFYIGELDTFGNTSYLASGILNSVTSVPVPSAVWLFGSGLIGLFSASKRRKL